MATYTPNTTFATKDALPPGDSAKKILGADFDAEFTEIQSVVNAKADANAPALTGSGTAVNMTVSGTLNSTGTLQIGGVSVTSTAAELNILDGATVTTAELNYLDGVTSNVQTQLDAKQGSGSYLTGNETITLSGDATGSGTTAITVTVDMSGLSGTTYAAGSGANITALNASNISSGTISDARLPASITSDITGNAATATTATNALAVDGKSVSVLTQAAYDALTPDANTLYFIT
jgi:hypothetical protein